MRTIVGMWFTDHHIMILHYDICENKKQVEKICLDVGFFVATNAENESI